MEKSIWTKIQEVDRRYIYVLMFIVTFYPILSPIGLPLKVSDLSKTFYTSVDSVPEGGLVVVFNSMSPDLWPETEPGTIGLFNHIFSRPLKLLIVHLVAGGVPLIDNALEISDKRGKVYGEDFVVTPFMMGGEPTIGAFCADIIGVVKTDIEGTPLEDLSMMKDIKTIKDASLVIQVTGSPIEPMIRQVYTTYDIPLAVIAVGGYVASYLPYYATGQLAAGILPGLRGGAEYELLIGKPGIGSTRTDCLSTMYLLIIGVVILGNIAYFMSRGRGVK